MSDATAQTTNEAATTSTDGAASTVLTDTAKPEGTQQPTQQDGQQGADGAKGEGEGQKAEGEKEGEKPAGAPEAYEDFKTPEDIKLDPELAGELKALAKEFNLPQEQAQKVADLGAKLAQKMQANQAEVLKAAREEWASNARADKEYGGDAFDANMATAKKAVDQFVSPELKTMLNETGLGNHPELIRTFVKIGKAIKEDGYVGGKGMTSTPTQTIAQRLYDKSPK